MPGKSKKGGGLTSSPVYKKQKFGEAKSPFTMKKSPAKYYQELEMFRKAAMGTTRFAGATATAIPTAIYSFGKESVRRKKAGLSGFNIKKTPTNKPFTFNKK